MQINNFFSSQKSAFRSISHQHFILIFLLSSCSISYELVLARLFSTMSSREIVWHSVTIAVYVLALGAGTAIASQFKESSTHDFLRIKPSKLLLIIEMLLTIIGAFSVFFVYELHGFLRVLFLPELIKIWSFIPLQPVDVTIIIGQFLCFIIGVLSGFEVPLLARMIQEQKPVQNSATKVLAINYMGTLGGTFLFIFGLAPFFSLGICAWAAAMLNFFCALFIFHTSEKSPDSYRVKASLAVCLLSLIALGISQDNAEQFALKASYYVNSRAAASEGYVKPSVNQVRNSSPILIKRSAYQTLHMVRPQNLPGAGPKLLPGEPFTLYIDKHFQISSTHEVLYHEFFVHYPISLMGRSESGIEKILILGGGDGLAARELLRYPSVKSITQVEIDPEMIALATTDPAFTFLNKNSLRDKRMNLIQDDAFTFLKQHRENYDAIFIDFPYPFSFDLSRLYSIEFYTFVRQNLKPNGFAILDMPLIPKTAPIQEARLVNDIFASTLSASGFRFLSPFGGEGVTGFDLETFMIALPEIPSGPVPEFTPPELPFVHLYQPGITHYSHNDFEFNIDPKLANSIFKPTMLMLRNSFL